MRCKKFCKNSKIISLTLIILLLGIFFISGCEDIRKDPEMEDAQQACIDICEDALIAEQDLSSGPCLSNDLLENGRWVCDVAHTPRTDIDDKPENQCEAYRNKTATHFVELTLGCKVKRAV